MVVSNNTNTTAIPTLLSDYSSYIILAIQVLLFIIPILFFVYYMRRMGIGVGNRKKELEAKMRNIPSVSWEQIYDMKELKQKLLDISNYVMSRKRAYGVILFGPPGTGKTSIAKALANELQASFIVVSGDEISSVGPFKAGELIAEKFHIAKDNSPSIIFIDEIDMIARTRGENEWRGALTELLSEMDGIRENEDVIIIGATNRPWDLDPALLRAGRFDRIIYVPPPDYEGRVKVLKVLTKGLSVDEEILNKVSRMTNNYTPADLKLVVDEIRRNLLKEATSTGNIRTSLNFDDFVRVLAYIKPSVNVELLKMYEQFRVER